MNQLNDIGILKLSSEVNLNSYVQTACLPDPSQSGYPVAANQNGYIVGWGTLSEGGSSPDNLQNTKITVYSENSCSNVYPNVVKNWNSQVCAGNIAGGKDTCQGIL